jgi:hypothetical protein
MWLGLEGGIIFVDNILYIRVSKLIRTVKSHFFFVLWRCDPTRVMASSFWRYLDHTQRRSTVGRTLLDQWSARRRNRYLTKHSTHNRQTSKPPGEIRTHNLSRRAAADLRLRPRGHWDRPSIVIRAIKLRKMFRYDLVISRSMRGLNGKGINHWSDRPNPKGRDHW